MKIEVYEIINKKCDEKEDRIWLVKNVMKVLKLEEKPDKKKLETVCTKMAKKYKVVLSSVICYDDKRKMQLNIKRPDGAFSCMVVQSYYEAMLKYILYAYSYVKSKNEKVK